MRMQDWLRERITRALAWWRAPVTARDRVTGAVVGGMSDLEEFGLVSAPHTSAGRVPTSQGYRVFVDSLLEMRPLGEPEVDQLRRELATGAPTPDLLGSATSLLSEMTRFVGVVSVPRREEFPFRHIDFVQLDDGRVLVILVFTDGQVQNRVIATQRGYSPAELEQVANYLNANFSGMRSPRAGTCSSPTSSASSTSASTGTTTTTCCMPLRTSTAR